MLIPAGKISEYKQEELKQLNVTIDYADYPRGNVRGFPSVASGWHVACAYNKFGFGIEDMSDMIVCETLEDMNELVRSSMRCGADVSWYAIPDQHFGIKTIIADECDDPAQTQTSSSFFKAKQDTGISSQDHSVSEANQKGWRIFK